MNKRRLTKSSVFLLSYISCNGSSTVLDYLNFCAHRLHMENNKKSSRCRTCSQTLESHSRLRRHLNGVARQEISTKLYEKFLNYFQIDLFLLLFLAFLPQEKKKKIRIRTRNKSKCGVWNGTLSRSCNWKIGPIKLSLWKVKINLIFAFSEVDFFLLDEKSPVFGFSECDERS